MSQVAGRLRLDLAQFRELEAFSQFASDLDKATKASIDRGRRIQEVLKQPQYQPVAVENQVMIIYAATNGYLDDVPAALVGAWEQGLYRYMAANHQEIIQEMIDKSIKGSSKMSADLLKKLGDAIDEYKQTAAPQQEKR
jgi:F-type H+-transporting ATPase subunit alpha